MKDNEKNVEKHAMATKTTALRRPTGLPVEGQSQQEYEMGKRALMHRLGLGCLR